MVQITVVWTVIYSSLQSLEWWLMRHTKNSHFITLFHTSLHCHPVYTHVYALYAHVTERVVTLYSGASLFTACVYAVRKR